MTASSTWRVPLRAVMLGVAATLTLMCLMLFAGSARAGDEEFTCSLGSGKACAGARHSLLMSAAYHDSTNRVIGAGAGTSANLSSLVGSFMWDNSWACHSYNGSRVLYPIIANGSVIPLTLYGLMSYGSDGAPC